MAHAAPVAQFLAALSQHDVTEALRVLAHTPAIGRSSLHVAAAIGDVTTVAAMLAAEPALASEPGPVEGIVPLIYAVHEAPKQALGVPRDAQLAVVRMLLDAGADPNATAPLVDVRGGIPALYFPCVHGNVPVARLLLERGANPTDGESLYHAAQHGHDDCLALLVEFGADVHRGPAAYGNTPLHFLASHTPRNPITPAAMRGLHWLLAHGADPRVPSTGPQVPETQRGETPLHRAAAVGHEATVLQALLAHGAPVHATRDDGLTAWQLAMRGGHDTAAQLLADAGAHTVLTPLDELLMACLAGRETEARQLVAAHPGLMEQLGAAEHDALGDAVVRDDLVAVRCLTRLGWPLAHEGEWGGTPLHWAAWNGRVEMTRLLVNAGAPVNVRDSRYGSSALAWCCHGSRYSAHANDVDYPAIAALLLDAGATRAESFNRWNEPPERFARPSVAAVLEARGFIA